MLIEAGASALQIVRKEARNFIDSVTQSLRCQSDACCHKSSHAFMHRPTKLAQPLRSRFKFKIGQARVVVIVFSVPQVGPAAQIVPQVGLFSYYYFAIIHIISLDVYYSYYINYVHYILKLRRIDGM